MSKKKELSLWIYDVPLPDVSIEERHRTIVQGMQNLKSPFSWRDLDVPAVPKRKRGDLSAAYSLRYPSFPIFHSGSYRIRDPKFIYNKSACDDQFSFEFKLGVAGLEYRTILHQHFPELVSAIGGYRATLSFGYYSIWFEDRHPEIREQLRDNDAVDTDGRNNIFCLNPVHYWSAALCQAALGYGPDEVIRRLKGKVPRVDPLMDGVYVVFNDNPNLTFEEYCAYNDALKPVLGLA